MNNRPMEIDIHHTSREDLIREVRDLEKQLDEYNFTNMKLDKEIKELQEELTNQHDRFDDLINSMKCCGNCDHYRTIPVKYHLEEYCNIIEDPQERRDIAKYDTKCTNWKQKENL